MSRNHYILWNCVEIFEINNFNVKMYLRSKLEVLRRLSKAAECPFAREIIRSLKMKITQKLEKIENIHSELILTEYLNILNSIAKEIKEIIDYFELKMLH
ncbi:MAG: hypothetical protein R6U96_15365 [Promethearchaeia archaeon]